MSVSLAMLPRRRKNGMAICVCDRHSPLGDAVDTETMSRLCGAVHVENDGQIIVSALFNQASSPAGSVCDVRW
jgi:hypothetical protein